jgi:DNA-binding transcriptional regulator YiaG
MEEDIELKLLKAKKMAELAKKLQEKSREKTAREIVLEHLVDRGDEVLIKAEELYPREMKIIVEKLTLSTAEAGRFLHTVPSTLWSTCVSAFTPSWFWDCLQWVCHHPVIPIL